MGAGASFLSVSEIRGDLEFLTRVLELATRKDVGAQALFLIGNFAGQILTPEERAQYDEARKILQKELEYRPDHYEKLRIRDVAMLGHYMSLNPASYRRQGENAALKTYRELIGLKDSSGRFVEVGKAGMRVRRFYSDAEKLFKKCPIPVYVMGDTIFSEDAIDQSRWLHFAWFSFSGYSVRALSSVEDESAAGVPEVAVGMTRGGKPVTLAEYPIASGDFIFARSLNPFLDETLNRVPGKLVIVVGDGVIDLHYPNTVLSSQKPMTAYFYRTEGAKFVRRTYRYNTGTWAAPSADDVAAARSQQGSGTESRRKVLEDQVKLASFGTELVQLVDLLRAENPSLAAEIEKSKSRVDAIMNYVRDLEAQRVRLVDALSAQRAGIERVVRALEPLLGGERTQKAGAVLNIPPASQMDVPTIDAANLEVVRLIQEALAAAPPPVAAPEKAIVPIP